MPGTPENEGESRLDRALIAGCAEHHLWFDEEYKRLLEAQARLTERLNGIIESNRNRPPLPD